MNDKNANILLSPLGLENPARTMEQFNEVGNKTLETLRNHVASPHKRKAQRTWGIIDAAELIGTTPQSLRRWEKEGFLNTPTYDNSNRRRYTLDEINQCRDKLGKRYKRPEGSKPIIQAISNFKGGSAKTVTTSHEAHYLALQGLNVLVVDLDPQATTTFILGGVIPDLEVDPNDTMCTTLLDDPNDIKRVIRNSHFTGVDFIPANLALQDVELGLPNPELSNVKTLGSPAYRLKNALSLVEDNYDVILIDCGPNLGILTINAIIAANSLLIPIPPSMLDYASFVMLTGTLSNLFAAIKKEIDVFRLLLTKHTGSNEARQIENMVRQQFGDYVLNNYMSETVEIAKATNDLGTVYETMHPRGSRDTYKRALSYLDNVYGELLSLYKRLWSNQAENKAASITKPVAEHTHE